MGQRQSARQVYLGRSPTRRPTQLSCEIRTRVVPRGRALPTAHLSSADLPENPDLSFSHAERDVSHGIGIEKPPLGPPVDAVYQKMSRSLFAPWQAGMAGSEYCGLLV